MLTTFGYTPVEPISDRFRTENADAWRPDDVTAYERAVELYAGDLLPEDPYEEWITSRGNALRASFLTLLTRAGKRAREQGQANRAIEIFQRLVTVEPVQEDAHVAEAAAKVTELLEHAPEVKALTTRRVRLRLHGEQEYEVSPLAPART